MTRMRSAPGKPRSITSSFTVSSTSDSSDLSDAILAIVTLWTKKSSIHKYLYKDQTIVLRCNKVQKESFAVFFDKISNKQIILIIEEFVYW